MKTYVLMISRTFPASHPKKGQRTNFISAMWHADKLHTIRANYPLWEKRIKEVQEGKAILSIRYWEDIPYRSKQVECMQFVQHSDLWIQKLVFSDNDFHQAVIDADSMLIRPSLYSLAKNDFLSISDFKLWFKKYDKTKPMAIIHFTQFRY